MKWMTIMATATALTPGKTYSSETVYKVGVRN